MGLDTVELLMAIEDGFAIQIAGQDAERLGTPNEVADHVMRIVGDSWSRDAALARILDMTAQQLGVPRARVLPNSHFIYDLNAD